MAFLCRISLSYSMNLFLLGLHAAALEFPIVDTLYTPYLLISITSLYVPGPGIFFFIFIDNGSIYKYELQPIS